MSPTIPTSLFFLQLSSYLWDGVDGRTYTCLCFRLLPTVAYSSLCECKPATIEGCTGLKINSKSIALVSADMRLFISHSHARSGFVVPLFLLVLTCCLVPTLCVFASSLFSCGSFALHPRWVSWRVRFLSLSLSFSLTFFQCVSEDRLHSAWAWNKKGLLVCWLKNAVWHTKGRRERDAAYTPRLQSITALPWFCIVMSLSLSLLLLLLVLSSLPFCLSLACFRKKK